MCFCAPLRSSTPCAPLRSATPSAPSALPPPAPLSALPPPTPLSALPPLAPLSALPPPVPLFALPPSVPLSLLPWHHRKTHLRASMARADHPQHSRALWAAGIVPSPVSATLPQITSRLFLVWGVLYLALQIVRYSFFAVKEAFGFTPAPLLWLRHNMFYVLYPSGTNPPSHPYCCAPLHPSPSPPPLRHISHPPAPCTARTRYSMFYVFYPSGITSEVGLAFLPLPYLKVRLAL
ncbi:unnamed protein product [Closterium sp. NIES-64]|nr:unnamed protein product [Closterium sp. NIES-64]